MNIVQGLRIYHDEKDDLVRINQAAVRCSADALGFAETAQTICHMSWQLSTAKPCGKLTLHLLSI
jgi:hypothetical protein